MANQHRAVYVISVAAELAGVHPQTLRIYERKGLVEPSRTVGGSRRYSEHDLERLQRIAELTDDGLNLAGVKRVLALEAQLVRLQEEVAELEQRLEALSAHERSQRRDLVPMDASIAPFRQLRDQRDPRSGPRS